MVRLVRLKTCLKLSELWCVKYITKIAYFLETPDIKKSFPKQSRERKPAKKAATRTTNHSDGSQFSDQWGERWQASGQPITEDNPAGNQSTESLPLTNQSLQDTPCGSANRRKSGITHVILLILSYLSHPLLSSPFLWFSGAPRSQISRNGNEIIE